MPTPESILNWLRAGYPEGVAPGDYAPLVALLRRTLTDAEVQEVVSHLDHEGLHGPTDRTTIKEAISSVAGTIATTDEIAAVAGRLASAGWPLASDVSDTPAETSRLQRILSWLRAGYPQGVPSTDYVPVLALLRRQLSDDEADTIALKLIADARALGQAPDVVAARAAILRTTDELPTDQDVQRVEERLRQQGWPFDATQNG